MRGSAGRGSRGRIVRAGLLTRVVGGWRGADGCVGRGRGRGQIGHGDDRARNPNSRVVDYHGNISFDPLFCSEGYRTIVLRDRLCFLGGCGRRGAAMSDASEMTAWRVSGAKSGV